VHEVAGSSALSDLLYFAHSREIQGRGAASASTHRPSWPCSFPIESDRLKIDGKCTRRRPQDGLSETLELQPECGVRCFLRFGALCSSIWQPQQAPFPSRRRAHAVPSHSPRAHGSATSRHTQNALLVAAPCSSFADTVVAGDGAPPGRGTTAGDHVGERRVAARRVALGRTGPATRDDTAPQRRSSASRRKGRPREEVMRLCRHRGADRSSRYVRLLRWQRHHESSAAAG